MSVLYELLYLLGVRPWERGGIPRDLRELIEGPGALPPGRALDVGCGTGPSAVYLAARGWDVTGVDVVARALERARARAAEAGVRLHLVHADVTAAADELARRGPFQLLLDAGCYHGLDDRQRAAYARVAADVAAEGAVLLLFALTPGGAARPRTFRGASEEELRARFARDWDLVGKRPHPGRPFFRGAGQLWYRLQRHAPPPGAPGAARRQRRDD